MSDVRHFCRTSYTPFSFSAIRSKQQARRNIPDRHRYIAQSRGPSALRLSGWKWSSHRTGQGMPRNQLASERRVFTGLPHDEGHCPVL